MTDLFGGLPAVIPPSFAELWACWPKGRKVGRDAAEKAYLKVLKDKSVTHQFLVERAVVYAASVEHFDRRSILHLSTWLNQKRYNDEIEAEGATHVAGTIGFGRDRGAERQDGIRRYFDATQRRSPERGDGRE